MGLLDTVRALAGGKTGQEESQQEVIAMQDNDMAGYYAGAAHDERMKNIGDFLGKVALSPTKINSRQMDTKGKIQRVRQMVIKEYGLAVLKEYEIEALMWEMHASQLLFSQNGMLDDLADSWLEEIESRCLFSRSKEGNSNFLTNSTKFVQRKETFMEQPSQLSKPTWKGTS